MHVHVYCSLSYYSYISLHYSTVIPTGPFNSKQLVITQLYVRTFLS